ncbi:MAG TPA: class I SAM-dependent methyltransferase [Stellaceae bacterium]|jgi:predicted O-methyltransferase YrrM
MSDPLFGVIASALNLIPSDFGGGCPVPKANVLAWLIRHFNIRATCEIGVYRGRSLFPQAIAHKVATGGMAYGVDPYSPYAAMEYDNIELAERIGAHTRATDWEAMYDRVIELRGAFDLDRHCTVVRQASADAAIEFARQGLRFGLVHIDGNHDTAPVMKDVELYLPLLEPDGFVVMDDASWGSVKPAVAAVAARAVPIIEVPDSLAGDYAVFRLGPDDPGHESLREVLRGYAFAVE